ncbi:hypothetical protein ACTXJR_05710 [Glutamicibacter ardleyensis]|uniref:hypothetical protein n=1 Tax=Glutamicibacter ardleyensis TaxID=225894 RepID=UPI003FD10B2B
MENINSSITKKIETEKARMKVSWNTIAENAGIATATFNRKRNGGTDWTATEVARIAEFFRIPFTDFFPTELVDLSKTA